MKPLCNAILVSVLALSLALPAGFAAPPQSQPQSKSQPASAGQQPASTDQSSQPQAQDQPAATDQTTSSDEEKAPTKVKPGSSKDVNSIGNRGVGKGVNLYSLEREKIGRASCRERV